MIGAQEIHAALSAAFPAAAAAAVAEGAEGSVDCPAATRDGLALNPRIGAEAAAAKAPPSVPGAAIYLNVILTAGQGWAASAVHTEGTCGTAEPAAGAVFRIREFAEASGAAAEAESAITGCASPVVAECALANAATLRNAFRCGRRAGCGSA